MAPDELHERRARFAERERAARIGDRCLDLAAVPDDAGVQEQSLDVTLAEAGNVLRVEAGERSPEILALAQNRQPGEAGLKAFEAEALEQPAFVGDRSPPFLIVVREIRRVAGNPTALGFRQSLP